MATVIIHEAKSNFSKFDDAAAKGEEIVIAKAGKPAARLVSLETLPAVRHFGALKGKIRIADNFDAPLPDEVLRAFEDS